MNEKKLVAKKNKPHDLICKPQLFLFNSSMLMKSANLFKCLVQDNILHIKPTSWSSVKHNWCPITSFRSSALTSDHQLTTGIKCALHSFLSTKKSWKQRQQLTALQLPQYFNISWLQYWTQQKWTTDVSEQIWKNEEDLIISKLPKSP